MGLTTIFAVIFLLFIFVFLGGLELIDDILYLAMAIGAAVAFIYLYII